ncbi:DUF2785 domain-containing protein [Paenisporosarcina sp. TG20]|uniref:DUF2785 domain-containing protein n=1 Tax=Paenisporosarcina sp. TG20 TaxID=1211706 RepID=UPI0003030347|nr:DUF2785 domain-containing protein [Paenisporosarcina sp. TG20]
MSNLTMILQSILSGEIKHVSNEFIDEMIENIGSTDPLLRDQLIYGAFCHLIKGHQLNKQQLDYILTVLQNKQLLTLDIEKTISDAVFTRSFTALFYAAILGYDASKQIVSKDLIRQVMDETHDYMSQEQDIRGYVESKGWAHAAAHGADLLVYIAKHPMSTDEDARKILLHIARFISISEGYRDDEEERLARSFVSLCKHHLSEEFIEEWFTELDHSLNERVATNPGELQPYYAKLAFKNFLKSSYFLFQKDDIHESLQHSIKQLIIKSIY